MPARPHNSGCKPKSGQYAEALEAPQFSPNLTAAIKETTSPAKGGMVSFFVWGPTHCLVVKRALSQRAVPRRDKKRYKPRTLCHPLPLQNAVPGLKALNSGKYVKAIFN